MTINRSKEWWIARARSEGDMPIGAGVPDAQPTEDALVKHMVDRFLSWQLPEAFHPDGGISFKATFNEHTAHPIKAEPTGTNLFDADQATAMVRYMLDGFDPTPAAAEARATKATEWTDARLDELSADLFNSATFLSDSMPGSIGERYGNLRHAARSAIANLRMRLNILLNIPAGRGEGGAAPSHPETPERSGDAGEAQLQIPLRPEQQPGIAIEISGLTKPRSGTAAPSPETGGPDLVPLDVFNEAERTHMAMVRETAAKASPETGWRMKPIPVSAAKKIAAEYGYDQVVIVARRVGEADDDGGEHVTTYGKDKANCDVAARTGDFLKFKIMGWREETKHEDFRTAAPAAPSPGLAALVEECASALKPFADYAPSPWNFAPPDNMIVTAGSSMAKRQLTIGDLRRARAAHSAILEAQPNAGPSADGGMGGASG